MPQHALAGDVMRGTRQTLAALLIWHDTRPRARLSSPRGWLWAALIAASFFWMSNPLVFVPSFYLSLGEVISWTTIAVLVTLPWLRLPRTPWPWVAFLALCLLSQLWTINDFHTDVSNIVYLEITALAVVVAANCTPQVVAWGMGLGGVAVVGLSLYAFENEMVGSSNAAIGGALFTGVGTNENILAYTLAVSLAATAAVGRPRHLVAQGAWATVIVANAYGLYLAGSGTGYLAALSILVTSVFLVASPALHRARRHLALAWAGVVVLLLLVGLLYVVIVLDKQLSTVSGRAPFWRAAIDATLQESPIFGSGWGAVWEHPWDPAAPNDVVSDIYARAGYPLSHGHNFFVDVFPELGLLGVSLALVMVVYAVREIRRCGLHTESHDPVAGRLLLLVLVALLVFGITEPMLTVPLGWWSLLLVVALPRQRVLKPGGPTRRTTRGRRVARGKYLVSAPPG